MRNESRLDDIASAAIATPQLAVKTEDALTALTGGAPAMVLAPHPDEETLACGALLAACFAGRGARVVAMTDGRLSHPNSRDWPGDLRAALRASEMRDAVGRLGGRPQDVTFLGQPDGDLPSAGPAFERAVETIGRLCIEDGVESLFAASDADPQGDYQASAQIARAVAARLPGLRLFFYPIWSRWTGGSQRLAAQGARIHRFPSAPWAQAKRSAIAAHRSQLGLVIQDDPACFTLPDALIERFLREDEVFFEAPCA